MLENTWGRVTVLVNLMFCRLDKFDGLYSGRGAYIQGTYIQDVNWVTYLGGVYSVGLIYGERINGILRYFFYMNLCVYILLY